MLSLIVLGVIVLLALAIVCFAAYRIRARRFEVYASIWKFLSLRITILSGPDDVDRDKRRPDLEP